MFSNSFLPDEIYKANVPIPVQSFRHQQSSDGLPGQKVIISMLNAPREYANISLISHAVISMNSNHYLPCDVIQCYYTKYLFMRGTNVHGH